MKIGDYVASVANGVCQIEETVEKDWMGEKRLFYVLNPINEKGSKVYVPVDNAAQRIRKVMTKSEAKEFIEKIPTIEPLEIVNEKFCEKEYKDAIYSGDPILMARAIKTIRNRIQVKEDNGKKAVSVDERYSKLGMHLLHSELAFALQCDEKEVLDKILEIL